MYSEIDKYSMFMICHQSFMRVCFLSRDKLVNNFEVRFHWNILLRLQTIKLTKLYF